MFVRKQQLPTSYEEYFQRLRYTHTLFMISPVIYVLVAVLLKQEVLGPQGGFVDLPSAEYNILSFVLLLAAIVVGVAACFLVPQRHPIAGLIEQSDSLLALGSALFQKHILRVTLADTPAIFGVTLFLLNGVMAHLVAFVLLSLLLLLVLFPRWATWAEARREFLAIHPY